jgi:hypothetical protein
MASPSQFTVLPAKPCDYPALTFLSLEAVATNPFFYLAFPPSVSPEKISQYHFESKIQPPDDISVEVIKIMDNSIVPTPRIVGFASWKLRPSGKEAAEPRLPDAADARFLTDFWAKATPMVDRYFNPETDIGK